MADDDVPAGDLLSGGVPAGRVYGGPDLDVPSGDLLSGGVPAGRVYGSPDLDVPSGDAGFREALPASAPDPAEGMSGQEPAVPVHEPEPQVPEEIDPLLLGPPLFDQQNRPLDAPQFPRSPRPAGSVASPLEGPSWTPGMVGPANERHGGIQGSAGDQAHAAAQPHMSGETDAGGQDHVSGQAHQAGSLWQR